MASVVHSDRSHKTKLVTVIDAIRYHCDLVCNRLGTMYFHLKYIYCHIQRRLGKKGITTRSISNAFVSRNASIQSLTVRMHQHKHPQAEGMDISMTQAVTRLPSYSYFEGDANKRIKYKQNKNKQNVNKRRIDWKFDLTHLLLQASSTVLGQSFYFLRSDYVSFFQVLFKIVYRITKFSQFVFSVSLVSASILKPSGRYIVQFSFQKYPGISSSAPESQNERKKLPS